MVNDMSNKKGLSIYFIHSRKSNYNELLYLPVLRSNILSDFNLILPASVENNNTYFKDLMDKASLIVVELTSPDLGFNMELNEAILSKKPILAIAQNSVGYEAKYQKLLKTVYGYNNEADVRNLVEKFVLANKDKVGLVDGKSSVILGTLN